MAYSYFERLSALDDSFLEIENGASHMHIGSVATFESGPFATSDGGIDIERIRTLMRGNLHRVPRYRQRLRWTPLFEHPVWVDDDRFNLDYHVRHTHLPKPGDERQLKRLAGRVMSQELDRSKPLWEMWIVEGLEQGGFAVITKIHHCMIDGVGSVELMGSVMRTTPGDDPSLLEPPPRWIPRPAPTPRELLLAEGMHRAAAPLKAAAAMCRAFVRPAEAVATARETATALAQTVASGLHPASSTPFNVPVGPYRRFDWTTCDLGALKAARTRHGGTVNDVVLTVLAGALGRFLSRRGMDPASLDFRVMVPVNVRDAVTRRDVGNRVAMLLVHLPLDERDPVRRLARVVEETTRAKSSRQVAGVRSLEALSDSTFTSVMVQFARLTALSRPYNLVVTNVPGPPKEVYIGGSRMLACHPLVPLFANQALGIALFSYAGRLDWGFNADWDALPDLHDLVEGVERELAAFQELGAGTLAGAS
jgi:diacylglycerol O-acyltransferase / wax synthase